MKIRFKHPVIVNVKSARSEKVTKTALTTTTTFDIPRLDIPADAVEAVSYRNRKQIDPTTFFETGGRFFNPETLPEGMVTGNGRSFPISATNNREITLAASSRLYNRAVDQIGSFKLTKTERENLSKSLLDQPDVNSLPRDRIDWDDYEAERTRVFQTVSNFVLIGTHLCHRTVEPFYAVSSAYNRTGLSVVTDGNIPEDMVAAFRIGRLEDARTFARRLADYIQGNSTVQVGFQDIDILTDNEGTNSNFDDIGVTLAVALDRAVKSFRHSFNHEYQGKVHIDDLVFSTPLDQLALVRDMNALVDNRTYHALAQDADRIGELIERAVAFGNRSKFTNGFNNPLPLIYELWSDREISFTPYQAPRP